MSNKQINFKKVFVYALFVLILYVFIYILIKITYNNVYIGLQPVIIKYEDINYRTSLDYDKTASDISQITTHLSEDFSQITTTISDYTTEQNEWNETQSEEISQESTSPAVVLEKTEKSSCSFDETKLSDCTLIKLKELLQCKERKNVKSTYRRGNYTVTLNIQEAEEKNIECHSTLTYATHSDFTFMESLEILVERWNAPISYALYAPGYDMETTVNSIRYVRDCSTVKDLIRKWVSFHVYYPVDHMPSSIPDVNKTFCCGKGAPYSKTSGLSSYRKTKNLFYPINVGRNIARNASVTHYYLMLDIELYPTPNLAARFLNMIARNHTLADSKWNKVFVLPPFEIEAGQRIPENKIQLLDMMKSQKAVRFHLYKCPNCHLVPGYEKWMKIGQTKYLDVIGVGKRMGTYFNWEPKFISTHSEPYVEERLSWEGMRDRMTMSYVLCVLDYDFLILSNAFLVHHPGINKSSNSDIRKMFMAKQSQFINNVLRKELDAKYSTRKGCVL